MRPERRPEFGAAVSGEFRVEAARERVRGFPAIKSKQSEAMLFAYAHGGRKVDSPPPLWPVILEKAFAKFVGGYAKLIGSSTGARLAFEAILGRKTPGDRPLGEPRLKAC